MYLVSQAVISIRVLYKVHQ